MMKNIFIKFIFQIGKEAFYRFFCGVGSLGHVQRSVQGSLDDFLQRLLRKSLIRRAGINQ